MNLHEYQAKSLLQQYDLPVAKGQVVTSVSEVKNALEAIGGNKWVAKVQVHAGGRGKGTLSSGLKGGVQILKTPKEVGEKTTQMLGYNLKTHQTTGDGLKVNAVLIHEGVDI